MKADHDSPEQKAARSENGGQGVKRAKTMDELWDEIQSANRSAGPWGALTIWRGEANSQ